ncbi:hypothetical protein DFH29DRAFT_951209 [Suillus ampliporus]|nr:hypothetical protein DFH29DRAFT_951209 [Suillus ampliporus]
MDAVSKAGLLVSRSLASETYGVLYMASLICVAFWAILCLQTFWYFGSYESDRKLLKFLTYVNVYGVWAFTIDQFGNYSFLAQVVSPYAVSNIVIHINSFRTDFSYFVRRISGNKLWMVVVVWAPLAIFQIVSAFVIVVKTCLSNSTLYLWAPAPKNLAITYLAVSLFVDIAIAIFLFELLRRHKEQTKVRSTLKIIQRLMLLAVLNMLWTSLFAICDMITFVSLQGEDFYILFDMPIGPLYCNTLLANLNMRASLRDRQSTVDMDLTTFDAVGPQPFPLRLGNDTKLSTQSGSRFSSELAA